MRIRFSKNLSQQGVHHIIIPVVAFVSVFAILGVFLMTRSHAVTYAHWCTTEPPPNYCANNNGGHVVIGNRIIAYPYENVDYHEYFTKRTSTGSKCSKVISTCPFVSGYGLNAKYSADSVVEYHYGSTAYCLGLNSTGTTALEPCGSSSTIFVFNDHTGSGTYGYTENVSQSNFFRAPVWLCHTSGSTLATSGVGTAAKCQWKPES